MATNDPFTASVAIVTGGASGMGLSVVKELVRRGWNVLVLDLNEEAGQKQKDRLGNQVSFKKTDVTDYEQLSEAFVETWKKHSRLDFVFANAGIGDLQDFYKPVEEREDGSPAEPNTLVLDVCLTHVIYAAWLSLHYFRKNADRNGRFVSTSSMCGLYPGEGIPQYTAAKHGAVMSFVDDESKNGLAAECSVDNIHYHTQQQFGDEMAEKLMTASFEKMWEERLAREGSERSNSRIGSS